ncbi:MAG: efflux RND transporter periplasmic adaptor subunit [Pseudomonadota bacterium]
MTDLISQDDRATTCRLREGPGRGWRRLLCRVVLLVAGLLPGPLAAETLTFEGRVEAVHRAELSSQLDGVVAEILFRAGDEVAAGQPMIRLDEADARLALRMAEARLAAARAELEGAAREAQRQEQLAARGIAPESVLAPLQTAKAAATAALALAEADLARAELDLSRTVIRAPIAGFAAPPLTNIGAFLEAESGAPLGRIIALDPVMIAYRVPYATRLETLSRAGAINLDDFFARIEITVLLPGGTPYPHRGQPDHASAEVDPADGTLTVRAALPNPEGLLRPGMPVVIHSTIGPVETGE